MGHILTEAPTAPPSMLCTYKDNAGHPVNPNDVYENRRARLSDGEVNRASEANRCANRYGFRYVGGNTTRFEKRMARYEERGSVSGDATEKNKEEGCEKTRFYGADAGKYVCRCRRLGDVREGNGRVATVVFSGSDVFKFQKRLMRLYDL